MRQNMQNMTKYAKYAYLGVYLGAPNMVKWGVPEKILQMQFGRVTQMIVPGLSVLNQWLVSEFDAGRVCQGIGSRIISLKNIHVYFITLVPKKLP